MTITSCSISYSLLMSISLIVATKGFMVDDVCHETNDPPLCLEALGGLQSQNRNLPDLGAVGFQTAVRGAIECQRKFELLLVSSPRTDLKPMFSQCQTRYEDAYGTMSAAQQASTFGRWDQVIPNVKPVLGDVDQCEDLFTGTSPVHSLGDKVRVAAEAIIVIANKILAQ